MSVDSQWVGAILRQTRELAGIARERMAEACGVSPGAVSHWESGRTIPNAAQIAAWARITDVPVEVLFRETGLMDQPESEPPTQIATVRDWWRSRRPSQSTHITKRRGWHKPVQAGDMPAEGQGGGRHTAYKVLLSAPQPLGLTG